MSRSIYKGPYIEASLARKITKLKKEGSDFAKIVIQTFSRRSTILPSFVGYTFEVYNGKKFIKFYVTETMVGRKLGEFSQTKVFAKHAGSKNANQKAGKKK